MELLDVFYDGEIIKNACHLTTANFHVEKINNFRGVKISHFHLQRFNCLCKYFIMNI